MLFIEQFLIKSASEAGPPPPPSGEYFLQTWGSNQDGQLGFVETTNLTEIQSWTVLSAGASHTAAIRSDGALFTWGSNVNGRLGDGTIGSVTPRPSPIQIGSSSWTAVSAGAAHTAAIRSDGILFTWGTGTNGILGDGTTNPRSSPVQIGSSSWTAVSAGSTHTTAIRSDGALFTWGLNTSGQLGDGTTVAKSSPVQIGSSSWTAIGAGTVHTAGISND
jgi:alpha-tubulin suppressor-like RCC1 family protein